MSSANKPFYFIREIGTQSYEGGYGMNAVPKLYTKGSASSVVAKKNKFADKQDKLSLTVAGLWPRYEAVPVTIIIGEP